MLAALLLASLAVLLGPSQGVATPDLSSHFTGLDATFVLLDDATCAYTRHDSARAARRFPPWSTFKVPHTAMLLESGIVPSATGGALSYECGAVVHATAFRVLEQAPSQAASLSSGQLSTHHRSGRAAP